MRTIKFRGKNIETGEWVYGFYTRGGYVKEDGTVKVRHIIHSDILYDVEKNTIGQYTGLQDKNGVEIYEEDIVKGCWNSVFTIVWEKHSTSFQARVNDRYQREISYFGLDKLEVIGNIHDNPELLKGE